jgi:hypothetical protein
MFVSQQSAGGQAVFVEGDTSKDETSKFIMARAKEAFGPVDILVRVDDNTYTLIVQCSILSFVCFALPRSTTPQLFGSGSLRM